MKNSKYVLATVLILSTQISFAKPLSGVSSLFIKDGVLLVIVLAVLAVLKITQTLLSSD